jgi:hypothetical protein
VRRVEFGIDAVAELGDAGGDRDHADSRERG